MIPSTSVLGTPISKREYVKRKTAAGSFLVELAEKVRDTIDMVSRVTMFELDRITLDALRNADPLKAAKSAWTVLAWHRMLRPYDHPARQHKFDDARFASIVEGDPESLFLYATMLLKAPDQRIYEKLKSQNASIANDYLKYAKDYLITERKIGNLNWLYNW